MPDTSTAHRDRRDFMALLTGATAISLAGNVAHTIERGDTTVTGVALASVAPLLLPVGVHFIPKAARVRAGARVVLTLAVVVAATAAFALSFDALTALAIAHNASPSLAWLFPVAVDVLAAAAAYALVVMREPGAEAATVTTPATSADDPATGAATVSDHPAAPAAPASSPVAEPLFGDAPQDFELAATWPDEVPATPAAHVAESATDPAATHRNMAAQLVADGVVRADPAVVAAALDTLAAGGSQRAAAATSGLHRSAVAKIVAATTSIPAA